MYVKAGPYFIHNHQCKIEILLYTLHSFIRLLAIHILNERSKIKIFFSDSLFSYFKLIRLKKNFLFLKYFRFKIKLKFKEMTRTLDVLNNVSDIILIIIARNPD